MLSGGRAPTAACEERSLSAVSFPGIRGCDSHCFSCPPLSMFAAAAAATVGAVNTPFILRWTTSFLRSSKVCVVAHTKIELDEGILLGYEDSGSRRGSKRRYS